MDEFVKQVSKKLIRDSKLDCYSSGFKGRGFRHTGLSGYIMLWSRTTVEDYKQHYFNYYCDKANKLEWSKYENAWTKYVHDNNGDIHDINDVDNIINDYLKFEKFIDKLLEN